MKKQKSKVFFSITPGASGAGVCPLEESDWNCSPTLFWTPVCCPLSSHPLLEFSDRFCVRGSKEDVKVITHDRFTLLWSLRTPSCVRLEGLEMPVTWQCF